MESFSFALFFPHSNLFISFLVLSILLSLPHSHPCQSLQSPKSGAVQLTRARRELLSSEWSPTCLIVSEVEKSFGEFRIGISRGLREGRRGISLRFSIPVRVRILDERFFGLDTKSQYFFFPIEFSMLVFSYTTLFRKKNDLFQGGGRPVVGEKLWAQTRKVCGRNFK
jgi:hypothetical protein